MIPRFFVATALAVALCPLASAVLAQKPSPARDSISMGGRTIPEGTTVQGPVVVAGGNLTVNGTIAGSAVAIAGDVIVATSGNVTGDAIAAFGDVRSSGTIQGQVRSLTGTFGASLRALFNGGESAPRTSRSPLELALGWLTVMMLIGLGILIFASPYLEGVVDVLEQSFWRSFMTGIVGELGVLPALVVVVVGLAITVIGVLLIPFAVVALVLVVAGLLALGFVAAARMTGAGLGGRGAGAISDKGSALRGIVIGLAIYMGLWIAAAALDNVAVAGTALRIVAFLLTFVAATAGFGAALLSRGGTRRDAVVAAPAPAADIGWQTPTPVAGVAAARRPRPTADGSRTR